ncbi:hypothetical protein PZ61_0236615 [Streptomyces sp. MNU77]|uniref:hypothetical protein n=1 Tax=Streptomyces sp. MNU77 TaxID=1573406 RepID=UPI0005E475FE|nr:hypothetical protein [Streptomyces sp. MNU77]OLO25923.1 hypothetical protein PZ61_0236615 [Streptomyces sp. MNU77]
MDELLVRYPPTERPVCDGANVAGPSSTRFYALVLASETAITSPADPIIWLRGEHIRFTIYDLDSSP